MWEKIKARLVDDWSKMLRWWSVQWALIGAILVPLLNAAPQVFPPELAALFPPSVRSILTALWLPDVHRVPGVEAKAPQWLA
jgi:hypothetical protein